MNPLKCILNPICKIRKRVLTSKIRSIHPALYFDKVCSIYAPFHTNRCNLQDQIFFNIAFLMENLLYVIRKNSACYYLNQQTSQTILNTCQLRTFFSLKTDRVFLEIFLFLLYTWLSSKRKMLIFRLFIPYLLGIETL